MVLVTNIRYGPLKQLCCVNRYEQTSYLSFFLHKCTFWAQFFFTWKRVNFAYMTTFSTSHTCHIWKISDFSTSVMWRHLKFLHMWRNFQFPYNCLMTNIRSLCSFTMWRGGAQVIKEVRGCGGAKWTDFPTTILGFFIRGDVREGTTKYFPESPFCQVSPLLWFWKFQI